MKSDSAYPCGTVATGPCQLRVRHLAEVGGGAVFSRCAYHPGAGSPYFGNVELAQPQMWAGGSSAGAYQHCSLRPTRYIDNTASSSR
ncbi:jg1818 [Pararge aegeria aegeria]|uniref:Jg1818 protein n=1 Tax=Pararge aegeria aegeria TaxID=348720 RepID=A0A8S4QM30_9NEOP|nr:jg1818 [Pararge aegeria aegeria]